MSIGNYTQLQTAVTNWLDNAEISAYVPDFIALGEADLWNDVRTREMESVTTITLSGSTQALPTNCIEIRRVDKWENSAYTNMQYVSEDTLTQKYKASGNPEYFTIIGSTIYFESDGSGMVVRISYYNKMDPLATTSTNSLLTNRPNLYLYSALKHSAPFMQEDNRIAVWAQMYASHVDSANMADMNRYSGPIIIENENRYL